MELMTKGRPTGLTCKDGLPITLPQLIQQALQHGSNHLRQVLDPYLISTKEVILEGVLHLALSCTSTDPEDRPDMDHVLNSLSKIRAMA